MLPEQQRTTDWRRISRVDVDFKENVECFEVCLFIVMDLIVKCFANRIASERNSLPYDSVDFSNVSLCNRTAEVTDFIDFRISLNYL